MVGDYMGKKKAIKSNKSDLSRQHQKIKDSYSDSNFSMKRIFVVILVIVIVLAFFYLLTIGILNKKSKTSVTSNTAIQYREILAGTSFTQQEKEYLVFYYDSKAEDADDNYSLIAKYSENKDKVYMYVVDLSEGLNRDCLSDGDNPDATNASELKINKTTVIRFKNGKILDYITDNIEDYLNK